MTMTDLSGFLLARIAEDEAVARAAHGPKWVPGAFVQEGRQLWSIVADPRPLVARVESESDVVHIARHDPARVLAECEAKAKIVGQYLGAACALERMADQPIKRVLGEMGVETLEDTLRLLALPYADHPDYQQEWAR